jgi:tRNA (guanine37-N1)-methyltransferase
MRIDILSLFPSYFKSPFDESIIKRAQNAGHVRIELTDIRDFAEDKFRRVDDRPYGGGPGMVLMPGPTINAIRHVKNNDSHVVYLSPQGKPLTAKKCRELASQKHLILLCGHYEGVDERVLNEVDEEISIGDYVLTNGCIAAIVLVDSVVRLLPGVLGHSEAAEQDSFEGVIFDHPHYTRPVNFEGISVPEVLQKGNHEEIAKWRYHKSLHKTYDIRPELFIEHFMPSLDELSTDKEEAVPLIFVENISRAKKFYCHALGYSVVSESKLCAKLRLFDQDVILVESSNVILSKEAMQVTLRLKAYEKLKLRLAKEKLEYVENKAYIVFKDHNQMIWYVKILCE